MAVANQDTQLIRKIESMYGWHMLQLALDGMQGYREDNSEDDDKDGDGEVAFRRPSFGDGDCSLETFIAKS